MKTFGSLIGGMALLMCVAVSQATAGTYDGVWEGTEASRGGAWRFILKGEFKNKFGCTGSVWFANQDHGIQYAGTAIKVLQG